VAGHSEEIGRGRGIMTRKGGDWAWTLDTAWPIEFYSGNIIMLLQGHLNPDRLYLRGVPVVTL
jgi:hypothetical protein